MLLSLRRKKKPIFIPVTAGCPISRPPLLPSNFLNSCTNLIYIFIGNSWIPKIHHKNLEQCNAVTFVIVFRFPTNATFFSIHCRHKKFAIQVHAISMFNVRDMRTWSCRQPLKITQLKIILFWNMLLKVFSDKNEQIVTIMN